MKIHSWHTVKCANLRYHLVPEGVVLTKTLGVEISGRMPDVVVLAILLDFVYTFSYFCICATSIP